LPGKTFLNLVFLSTINLFVMSKHVGKDLSDVVLARKVRLLFAVGLAVAIGMATACDPPEKKPAGSARLPEVVTECFLYVHGRDSIKLSVVSENGEVHGQLAYLFYEKDKSMGTVEGEMRGDTLFCRIPFFFRRHVFPQRAGTPEKG
jgi:hypothetical protein